MVTDKILRFIAKIYNFCFSFFTSKATYQGYRLSAYVIPCFTILTMYILYHFNFLFQYFFHHRNAVDLKQVLKESYRIMDATPANIHPRKVLDNFQPLTTGQYPVFNKYPKFIVDYQVLSKSCSVLFYLFDSYNKILLSWNHVFACMKCFFVFITAVSKSSTANILL